jgi:cobalt-zinc-cadmium efflux system outer membrane protein
VLEERRGLTLRLLEMKKAQVRAGEAASIDVITLDAERVAVDTEIADRNLDRITARLALARMIGRPSGRTDWRLAPWQAASPVRAPETAWVSAALQRRPDIQAGRWELAALGDELAIASLSPFNQLAAGAEAERDIEWSVGPSITFPIPLFDMGQASGAKARAQQIAARHKLTDTRRLAVEEVRRAYQTFAVAQATLERTRSELIPLQEKRVAQAEAAYRVGEAGLLVWLDAQRSLQEAREKLVDLQQKSSIALFQLQRAAGGPAVASEIERAGAPGSAPATQPTTPQSG